jgi:hypothetical protein
MNDTPVNVKSRLETLTPRLTEEYSINVLFAFKKNDCQILKIQNLINQTLKTALLDSSSRINTNDDLTTIIQWLVMRYFQKDEFDC